MNWKVFAFVLTFIPAVAFLGWIGSSGMLWIDRHMGVAAAVVIWLAVFTLCAALLAGLLTRGLA
jgi:hypothetical protein